MEMGEQADEERLAELNRNKERYEQMHQEQQQGEERQLHDDVREQRRRNSLQEQREREEQERKDEVEASASRIAAGRKKYRDDKQEIEDSAKRIAEGRQKYRDQQEIEASATRIAAGKQKYREQVQEDSYRRNTPLKTQLLDSFLGRDREPKKVEPITTFGGAVKYKAKQRASSAVTSFFDELSRPAKAVQKGREERRAGRQVHMIDPFQQGAPVRKKRARSSNSRTPVKEGTGMLFTEGFFNPPRRAGRRGKKGSSGGVIDFLL